MSRAENKPAQPMDRTLMRASQILTKTFTKPHEYNPDLDLLVNPVKSDYNKIAQPESKSISHEHDHLEEPTKMSKVFPYLLLAALCLDGFFEGIALGVQSSWNNVLFVAGAIIIYKISVAFSLGISIRKSQTDMQTFIRFVILFSLFCPFGIVVGYFSVDNLLLKGIFLAVSSGTFIYVSTSVVIVEEFAITRHRFSKYFFYLLGGIATAAIAIVEQLD